MLRLLPLLFALLALPAFAAGPTTLPENELMYWSGEGGPTQVFTLDDLTATLSFSGDEAELIATLKVEKPGTAPVEVSGLASGTGYGQIGVVYFDDNRMRSVIFGVYSGGAHCCTTFTAVTETPSGLVSGEVGTVDGDGGLITDIDGDGVHEMPLLDGRFNYAFDAFAMSIAPALIMTSTDGVIHDRSTEVRFRPFFQAELEETRPYCGENNWELGACAGLLANAARLGTFEAEMALVEAGLKARQKTSGWEEFEICSADCSERPLFTGFPEAIRYALEQWGYLPAR